MATRKPTPERLAAPSDGVMAVIITTMVLELKAPHNASLWALLVLRPTSLSYAMTYLLLDIFWVNHHHLFQHTAHAEPMVIWANLLALFFVSLIPIAFMILQKAIAQQFGTNAGSGAMDRATRKQNWIALVLYAVAIPAAYLHPAISLLIILSIATLYFLPDAPRRT